MWQNNMPAETEAATHRQQVWPSELHNCGYFMPEQQPEQVAAIKLNQQNNLHYANRVAIFV